MRSLKSTGGLTRGRGMSESQRTKWLLSMPICLQMNSAMQKFTQTDYRTSEQHKETMESRISKDSKDMNTMMAFLCDRNPFDPTETNLRNIESGVTADDSANVDRAQVIGKAIVQGMRGTPQQKYTFKRSMQAVPINEKSLVKLDGESLHIDTQLLFQRLTTAADRYIEDVSSVFQFELSSVPSSLFDNNGFPREPQKSTLADAIWKQCRFEESTPTNVTPTNAVVVDGGSLLHKLPWKIGDSFHEICSSYSCYLKQRYQNSTTIVFDGYSAGPDTKDVAHLRRSKGKVGTHVKFSEDTPLRMKKEVFLNNQENKQAFIDMLGACLTTNGMDVVHARGDADTLIVDTAINLAKQTPTTVIGEDTDLLVLLLHHYTADLNQMQFRSDSKSTKSVKIWDIRATQTTLGTTLCQSLPLLHALTGCDTTSRIFGVGKPAVLKLFQKKPYFQELCEQFLEATSSNSIKQCGESLMLAVYDGSDAENLNALRYKNFTSKVITNNSSVQVQTLPPTSDAAALHCLRVYFQTQVWMGNSSLNPLEYGWRIDEGKLVPLKMTLSPAPVSLLQKVRCGCKIHCDSKRCSCRRHGLECSSACKACKGVSCSNSKGLSDMQDIEDDS